MSRAALSGIDKTTRRRPPVVESRPTMNYHLRPEKLSHLSAHLEELFSKILDGGCRESLPPDLADEIAATAGEIMVELADHRGDAFVRGVIDEARRLREVVRTACPEAVLAIDAGMHLVDDLALVIRDERHAA